jgi:hypothetical protein
MPRCLIIGKAAPGKKKKKKKCPNRLIFFWFCWKKNGFGFWVLGLGFCVSSLSSCFTGYHDYYRHCNAAILSLSRRGAEDAEELR